MVGEERIGGLDDRPQPLPLVAFGRYRERVVGLRPDLTVTRGCPHDRYSDTSRPPSCAGTGTVIGKDGPVTTPPPPPPGSGPPSGRYAGSPFASWGRRVLGYLIDVVLLAVVIEIVRLVGGGLIVEAVVYIAGLALLGWMNGASGRTPGKRVVGIRVVRDADGRVLGGGLGQVRALCHFLDTVAGRAERGR
jgi:hypothetical protein